MLKAELNEYETTLRQTHVTLVDVVTDCIADLIILEARANRIQNDFRLKKGGIVWACDVHPIGWRHSVRRRSKRG